MSNFVSKKKQKNNSFSLWELIIIISIIALVMTISTIAYSRMRDKSDDLVRISDIKGIRSALQEYYQDNGFYPNSLNPGSPLINPSGTKTYLDVVPNYKNSEKSSCASFTEYSYNTTEAGSNYSLTYCLDQNYTQVAPGINTATKSSLTAPVSAPAFTCGTSMVDYAGVSYHTVAIGSQCWLKENLNVGTRMSSCKNGSGIGVDCSGNCNLLCSSRNATYVTNWPTDNTLPNPDNPATIEKFCYNDLESNCTSHGGLYRWAEAMALGSGCNGTNNPPCAWTGNRRGICPAGWHVPSDCEYMIAARVLEPAYVAEPNLGVTCAISSQTLAMCNCQYGSALGTMMKLGGSSGLDIKLSGQWNTTLSPAAYSGNGSVGYLISSSRHQFNAFALEQFTTSPRPYRLGKTSNNVANSVRCVKD